MAPHIVLEEGGEKNEKKRMDLSKGEQKTPEYMKIHPLGRVPALKLDDGSPLTENTAILPFLGKRFGLWPTDPVKEAKALSLIGFFAASVHPANGHVGRPERYTEDKNLEGMILGANVLPYVATGNPAMVEFIDAMKRFAPGVTVGPSEVQGWVAGRLLELAGASLPEPPTSAALLGIRL